MDNLGIAVAPLGDVMLAGSADGVSGIANFGMGSVTLQGTDPFIVRLLP
jgi:hypothetical protein